MESAFVRECAKRIPVINETDVCVLGGSCTGVFAAIRAARLGMKVTLVENTNRLGGTATTGLVNVWHSLLDDTRTKQIVGGLTDEVEKRMFDAGRLVYRNNDDIGANLDPVYLTYLLDCMAEENGIYLYLHTKYTSLIERDGKIDCVLVENKDGRGAIKAEFYIDCTGDGDVCRDLGLKSFRNKMLQPPSTCFFLYGSNEGEDLEKLVIEHGEEFGLDNDHGWRGIIPGLGDNITFRADNRVFGVDASKADDLTKAEIIGRKQAMMIEALLDKYGKRHHQIVNLASGIGIRDTVHYETVYKVKENDLLFGIEYEDSILHGTYRLDVHHQYDNGVTFKYVDGRVVTLYGKGDKMTESNWRKELGLGPADKHWYSIPFKTLVQDKISNFIMAGRMVNAEEYAYGALRVMVNTNQMGEAAGVAAALALKNNLPVWQVSGKEVHDALNDGGSLL